MDYIGLQDLLVKCFIVSCLSEKKKKKILFRSLLLLVCVTLFA